MKIYCKYFANPVRLANGIEVFAKELDFRFYCIDGSILRDKNRFKLVTSTVSVCVAYISEKTHKDLMVLLTNDMKYKSYDNKTIDTEIITSDGIFNLLFKFLCDKYKVTKNIFLIEFKTEDALISLSIDSDTNPICCVKGANGNVQVTGEQAIKETLFNCKSICRFEYNIDSPDLNKNVKVSRSLGEIYREIAHYLHKTLILVSFLDDGRMIEQYISSNGMLEIYSKPDGTHFYKRVSANQVYSSLPSCIALTTSSVEDVLKEQKQFLRK